MLGTGSELKIQNSERSNREPMHTHNATHVGIIRRVPGLRGVSLVFNFTPGGRCTCRPTAMGRRPTFKCLVGADGPSRLINIITTYEHLDLLVRDTFVWRSGAITPCPITTYRSGHVRLAFGTRSFTLGRIQATARFTGPFGLRSNTVRARSGTFPCRLPCFVYFPYCDCGHTGAAPKTYTII